MSYRSHSEKRHDRFTADHAMDITLSRQESFEKTMAMIRNTIDEHIREAAKMGRQSVFVEIPRNVFGRENFDVVEMGRAIVDQLIEDKFEMSGTYTRFTVRWGDKKKRTVVIPKQQQAPVSPKPVVTVPTPRKRY